ncbi:MAG: hypothetical protein C0514_07070 [Candidatus Puniceispirillum sp.]|nr:hypothetical protein [Candidatus Puniceispirillum sp.]
MNIIKYKILLITCFLYDTSEASGPLPLFSADDKEFAREMFSGVFYPKAPPRRELNEVERLWEATKPCAPPNPELKVLPDFYQHWMRRTAHESRVDSHEISPKIHEDMHAPSSSSTQVFTHAPTQESASPHVPLQSVHDVSNVSPVPSALPTAAPHFTPPSFQSPAPQNQSPSVARHNIVSSAAYHISALLDLMPHVFSPAMRQMQAIAPEAGHVLQSWQGHQTWEDVSFEPKAQPYDGPIHLEPWPTQPVHSKRPHAKRTRLKPSRDKHSTKRQR